MTKCSLCKFLCGCLLFLIPSISSFYAILEMKAQFLRCPVRYAIMIIFVCVLTNQLVLLFTWVKLNLAVLCSVCILLVNRVIVEFLCQPLLNLLAARVHVHVIS